MYCVLTGSFSYIFVNSCGFFQTYRGAFHFLNSQVESALLLLFWWWDFYLNGSDDGTSEEHWHTFLSYCISNFTFVWCRDQTFCTYNNKNIRIRGSTIECGYFLAGKIPLVTLFLGSMYHFAYMYFSMGVWEQTIDKFQLFLPLLVWKVLCICVAFFG